VRSHSRSATAGPPRGVTLPTPGDDRERVAGVLSTNGIISQPGQLLSVETDDNPPVNSGAQTNLVPVTFESLRRSVV
jgi:hypothetical protein